MKFLLAILCVSFLLPLQWLNAQTTCYSKDVEQTFMLYSAPLESNHEKLEKKFFYISGEEDGQVTLNLPDTGEYVILVIAEKAASVKEGKVFLEGTNLRITESRPEKHVLKMELEKSAGGDCNVQVSVMRNSGFDSCTGFYLFRKR